MREGAGALKSEKGQNAVRACTCKKAVWTRDMQPGTMGESILKEINERSLFARAALAPAGLSGGQSLQVRVGAPANRPPYRAHSANARSTGRDEKRKAASLSQLGIGRH
jgi:hypothetical protein